MKKHGTIVILTFVLCNFLLAGCTQQPTAAASSDRTDDITVQHISSILPAMTQEDMIEQSTLIVRGTVTAQSEPFQIAPTTGGDPSNFIDYTVSVIEVLRGDSSKQSVTVRVEGGTVNGMSTVAEEAPELPANTELLLYLYQPGMGTMYNTEGDYYYVTGMYRGVYTLDTKETTARFINERNESDPDLEAVWQADEVEAAIRTYTQSHPVDETAIRDEAIQQYEDELSSGAITQDEYQQAIQEIDTYATIVDTTSE